jgi:DeoR family suf operon transcriptional repressor
MATSLSESMPSLGPGGALRGPRGQALVELKRAQPLTAKDLAARLGLSLNAIRHHLKELEAEALVEYVREHRGVGAPAFAYRLSATGNALFPRRYQETLTAVLEQVEAREGRAAAVQMLESHFTALAARLKVELAGVEPAERMAIVTRTLAEEGYMAEWQSAGAGRATLKEHNCAIHAVAERYPEICAAERRFLEEVLSAAVDRRAHILGGCTACEYHVQFDSDGASAPEMVQMRPREARPGANA